MSIESVSFQTRARAIDHLGRGQIADAPTAISELWKNAYDAYAENVSLHIFDGTPSIASILDDGIGMSLTDVLNKWLVIGTESKIEELLPKIETLGLPQRVKQGEKGIGRLSVAFLAPGTILISKQKNSDFVAIAVDWRLFENPFLDLNDIKLPVETYKTAEELAKGLPSLLSILKSNFQTNKTKSAWKRYADLEKLQLISSSTEQNICNLWKSMPVTRRHLEEWPVFMGQADHGTAIFMIDLNNELGVWVRPNEVGDEVDEVKDKLRQTLTNFIDPYSHDKPQFNYEAYVHKGDSDIQIVSSDDVFGLDSLRELEHSIEGSFDEKGTFTGRIVAFGKDLGTHTYIPKRPLSIKGKDRLGPFSFIIGSFEQEERRSTHEANQHALLEQQSEKYSGILVFRDCLRVMPYGRPDADFLGLEERRSKHAGRYFFAHRKSFGRVAFSRLKNPYLKDKAGREGLVDNRAFREMRILLIEFLIDAAKRYFGSGSSLREEMMPIIMKRKLLQKEAAEKARVRRRKSLRQFIKANSPSLDKALNQVKSSIELGRNTLQSKDRKQATILSSRAKEARAAVENLRPPTPSSRMGDLQEMWRVYRDNYQALVQETETLGIISAEVEANLDPEQPIEVLTKRFEEQSLVLNRQLNTFGKVIEEHLKSLSNIWSKNIVEDKDKLKQRVADLLSAKITADNLLDMLKLVDANQADLSEVFAENYTSFISALENLIEGIDLQGAVDISNEFREELEEQINDLKAVAQVGITVEIIGHELETLESEVKRNLSKLPSSVKESPAYKAALRSHLALADRLRFLAPLKIGGYRSRETISGNQLANYIEEFFSNLLKERNIELKITSSFRNLSIVDIPSRIYPVFINLVNNAIYWVSHAEKKVIELDYKDGLAIIADTGPGVDSEDIPRLFTIFFSTRQSGRGLGLYLSKANLAVAGHKIRYATSDDPKILGGANFVIEFKGVTSNG